MGNKYRSCNLIQHGLCFFDSQIVSCCYSPVDQIDGQQPPSIYKNYKGEFLTREELFSLIEKHSRIFKEGGTPPQCKGCFKIEEKEWEENDKYIDFVTVSHYSVCNADCVYCSNNLTPEERTNDSYKILPVLKKFKEDGVLKEGFELHIGGGEFSIYEESDAIIEEFALTNFAKVYIATNAIKYSQKIFEALDNRSSVIILSLDSGCRETYKKVKRIDAFEKVIENLSKYASTENSRQQITLKYIIIPTMNDNMTEFKKFIEIAKRFKVKYVSIDIEARYSRSVNHHIDYFYYELAEKMKKIAESCNCFEDVQLHSFMQQDKEIIKEYKNKPLKRIAGFIKTKLDGKKFKKLYTEHKYWFLILFTLKSVNVQVWILSWFSCLC